MTGIDETPPIDCGMLPEAQVARLTPAGALDPAFSGDGFVTVGPDGSSLGGLTFQPDGKIAATTGTANGDLTDSVARISRLTQAGTPDPGFAASGSQTVDPGPKTTYLGPITWDPAGRLVAGGSLFDGDMFTQKDELARVLADSPPAAAISGPATAVAGTPATFSASDSTDPGGAVTGYAWDLDADGSYDDATTVSVSTTFGAAGSPAIAVRVQDANGLTATASKAVAVTAPLPQTNPLPQTVPPAGTPTGPGKATAKVRKLRFTKNGVLKVPVRCPAGGGKCKGKIQVKQGKKKLSSSGGYSLPAGGRTTVSIVLKAKVRKAISRRGAKGKQVTLVIGKKTVKVKLVRD